MLPAMDTMTALTTLSLGGALDTAIRRYRTANPISEGLQARAAEVMPGGNTRSVLFYPPFPLYMSGAEMVATYPMGPIMDGAGLNITVMSYRENVDIGYLGCTDLVPDIWDIADATSVAFDEIKQAVAELDPTITKAPAPVTTTRTSTSNGRRSATDQ